MKKGFVIVVLIFIHFCTTEAQVKTSFNDGWFFSFKNQKEDAAQVVLPHHYNNDAYQTANYYRGEATYTKHFFIDAISKNADSYLYFEGVNSLATVIVNGETIKTHKGGYTGFYVNINEAIKYDSLNTISVVVDNTNQDIPPLSGDFTIFGGIYRPVWFIQKNKLQFAIDDLGGAGVKFYTKSISHTEARGALTIDVKNNTETKLKSTIQIKCIDPNGKEVFNKSIKQNISNGVKRIDYTMPEIKNPMLWSPDTPNLYKLELNIINSKSVVVDALTENIGWRWLELDNNNALVLNGEALKLMGVSRHQDRDAQGIALTDQQHYDDIALVKEMGNNFIRLAHYPQSKAVLDACDELGLLVWEEIPVVDLVNNNNAFKANAKSALSEMIQQHFNHPSIIMWGYMNEAIIQVPYRIKNKKECDAQYKATVDLAYELEALTKELDPSRYTVMAYHGTQLYNEIGLAEVADISGWNLYDGWYGNSINDFEDFVVNEHQKYPTRPLIISEFGAGSDKRIHSFNPQKFDFSIEYQQEFMEHYWPVIRDSSYIMGGAMWNLIDFSSAARQESMPRINNKGMVYKNREPKDVFYYQKALLTDHEPVLHIATRDWDNRTLLETDSIQFIKVYSNSDSIKLYMDDVFIGQKAVKNFSAKWALAIKDGKHVLKATSISNDGKKADDITYININTQEKQIAGSDKVAIHINAGSEAYFHQDNSSIVFMPDVAYEKGSWGYISGEPLIKGDRPGTTAEIKGTNDDPLFQTQRQGEFTYKFDVKPGTYELTLHFADLQHSGAPLAYDLGAQQNTHTENVSMDITVNNTVIEKNFSPSDLVGGCHSLSKTYLITTDSQSIEINFNSVQSLPFINGISLITK
ncbi:glycoside hydrolase family 2 [Saccharicrinis aurantiacus]|uniref:glycoside hydrolase family 2 n=1 Tax=Saccharicrinis aurantiacus TaxID=1849719 RepID=UPI0009502091|nr:glycoside hydrolase family 2 [Saccharicrinis aurantiacus]